jgi:hypothetical protein
MMHAACLRRFLNVFLVMYRNIELAEITETVGFDPDTDRFDVEHTICAHHVHAGLVSFYIYLEQVYMLCCIFYDYVYRMSFTCSP